MSGSITPIPFRQIETVFFDVGNTLISVDYRWVAAELESLDESVSPTGLERADEVARPRIAQRLLDESEGAAEQLFAVYLEEVLQALRSSGAKLSGAPHALAAQLVPILRAPGQTSRLWSRVLPNVAEALSELKQAGLRLVVVSNSDGSIESALRDRQLRGFFDAVVDSSVVGFEKPDRRIFEHALERVGADPLGTLHVGDLYPADVLGARGAGIHAALVDPADVWHDADCPRFRDVREIQLAICRERRGD